MSTVAVLWLLAGVAAVCGSSEQPRVVTENGAVVGTYELSYAGHKYRAFRGIPFAEPPVGSNRFKEPQPLKEKWIGDWPATDYGSMCLNLDQFSDVQYEFILRGDEDCLFLNVFTQEGGPAKKNVMVMIHGGAFMFGGSKMYGPKYIMDRDDVIYVTINYRLGPLGFLTTGDSVVPGNNGLKDQVAALQWVNRNIANFGGDPEKVTLTGLSAGGASVDYHFLTNLSKGLFQKGVSFSGSALCPWALVENGPERSKKLAETLGCPTGDSKAMVKCLRRRPATKIVDAMRAQFVWRYNPFTLFGPVVEVGSSRPFIDKRPSEIHRLGLGQQLPWIGGVTTEEGLYPAGEFIDNEKLMKELNEKWLTVGPSLLFTDPHQCPKATQTILDEAKKQYFGDKDISVNTAQALVKLLSDRLFGVGLVETARYRKGARLFLYGYQSASSLAHAFSRIVRDYGASHGDDVHHIVDFDMVESHQNEPDIQMANVLNNILFDFIKTGSVPKEYSDWDALATSNNYLYIQSPDKVTVENKPFFDIEAYKRIFQLKKSRDEL